MNLIERDLKTLWHPCSQMKDYEQFPPLEIIKASGPYLTTKNGDQIIDAISSWWCKSLGHNHPRLKKALSTQMEKFEHVILANTTNETIVALSEKLVQLTNSLNKVFYASDGSSAIEIAMKMSLSSRKNQGDHKRQNFIALENSYHGETLFTLAVSDVDLYKNPYESLLPPVKFIKNIPYVNSTSDPLWQDCSSIWQSIELQLNQHAETTTAIIFEPILQGAGGMKIYSQDFLKRLSLWAKNNHVHLIADEIMTGIGRTGKPLACQHAGIEPDFICLSKGLTSGWLPLSAVITSQEIYDIFYDDYDSGKAFMHSHTYSGNALAAAVALECLNVMEEENIYAKACDMEEDLLLSMQAVANETGKLKNIRAIGAMVAADLIVDEKKNPRAGYNIYQKAVSLGALLRPLGNTLYWLPPLNTSRDTLSDLKSITQEAIQQVLTE